MSRLASSLSWLMRGERYHWGFGIRDSEDASSCPFEPAKRRRRGARREIQIVAVLEEDFSPCFTPPGFRRLEMTSEPPELLRRAVHVAADDHDRDVVVE